MIIPRRRFLELASTSVPAVILAACDSQGPRAAQRLVRAMERRNLVVEQKLFRASSRDVAATSKVAGEALPSYFISKTVPVWDDRVRGKWTLEVGGMVKRPLRLTLDDLVAMPRVRQKVNHYCVEGWTAVAEWTGVRVSELARLAGADPNAMAVDFASFDNDYHESWDLASAMHAQTVIAYGLDGRFLGPAYGAPARVHSPIKLGYKSTKYLTKVTFLPKGNGGYWSDQGYEWYGGV
jgi:DMSO/TMAO reductase YedYZ molybdopterin-dependent catalytic subunit